MKSNIPSGLPTATILPDGEMPAKRAPSQNAWTISRKSGLICVLFRCDGKWKPLQLSVTGPTTMENRVFYLRQNVQVEPLVDHWYAWPHLISPANAARNITERHLKIMDSYISNPQIHANAVKNPKMMGGPFIDYGGKRVNEIRELRDRIRKERSQLLELSAAIGALDAMLRENAKGHSLQALYPKVPDILRGYVELVYDLNNHPSFRLLEPLLYRSRYYDRSQQSLMLSKIQNDARPFVLSTPRLESDGSLHLPIPYHHEAVHRPFRPPTGPQPLPSIQDTL